MPWQDRPLARIVVGVDGSEASVAALRWAVAEAALRSAEVEAVHAWTYPPLTSIPGVMPPPTFARDELAGDARKVLDEACAKVDARDVHVRRIVTEGAAAHRLVDQAKGADLLVVGSRGHGGFVGLLLGSVSHQVAHHAPCPVAIIR